MMVAMGKWICWFVGLWSGPTIVVMSLWFVNGGDGLGLFMLWRGELGSWGRKKKKKSDGEEREKSNI